MSTRIQWTVFITLLLCLGGGVWFVLHRTPEANPFLFQEPIEQPSDTQAPLLVVDDQHQRFLHPRYGFSLVVPKDLSVERYDEGQSTETVVFAPADGGEDVSKPQFQIFVTPYLPLDITPERIRYDIPDGTVSDTQVALLGPAKDIEALIFTSTTKMLGESREVWFTRNGYLFEVTAPMVYDAWLADILATLQFAL